MGDRYVLAQARTMDAKARQIPCDSIKTNK
jgi:hypothetical protein